MSIISPKDRGNNESKVPPILPIWSAECWGTQLLQRCKGLGGTRVVASLQSLNASDAKTVEKEEKKIIR